MPREQAASIIFDTVAIVGVGLIGGSLGMAAKKNGLAWRVVGIGRSEQKLMRAKILGAIDEYTLDLENGAAEADLVIICTPVRTVVPTLAKMAAALKPGAVVTDVGSTKHHIVDQANAVIPDGCEFIGGHPMAGSEEAGVEAAFPDLFVGATYVLTPTEENELATLGRMTAFAEGVGARVEVLDPTEHDRAVALISHLPHTMSAALLHAVSNPSSGSAKALKLAAGSFRDLTRISDSPPEIWRDICLTNAASIIEAIGELEISLADFKSVLASGDEEAVMRFFTEAREVRQAFLRMKK